MAKFIVREYIPVLTYKYPCFYLCIYSFGLPYVPILAGQSRFSGLRSGRFARNPRQIRNGSIPFFTEHYFLGTNFFSLTSVPLCPFGNMACLLFVAVNILIHISKKNH